MLYTPSPAALYHQPKAPADEGHAVIASRGGVAIQDGERGPCLLDCRAEAGSQ